VGFMARKTVISFIVFLSLFSTSAFCGDQDVKITPSGWALITADIALSGLSAWILYDRNTQAGIYNGLWKEINNTTDANYWRLKYEKSKVDARDFNAALSFSLAGAALAYTVLDLFWFHGAFPLDIQPVIDPANKGTGINIREVF